MARKVRMRNFERRTEYFKNGKFFMLNGLDPDLKILMMTYWKLDKEI